jgi:hypothetical protein
LKRSYRNNNTSEVRNIYNTVEPSEVKESRKISTILCASPFTTFVSLLSRRARLNSSFPGYMYQALFYGGTIAYTNLMNFNLWSHKPSSPRVESFVVGRLFFTLKLYFSSHQLVFIENELDFFLHLHFFDILTGKKTDSTIHTIFSPQFGNSRIYWRAFF